jgi:UDP-N-acetylglucosamine transferase subunit ALG13
LIVTSGAGFAVPFCIAARAMGARVIFIETMARIRTSSKGGRVLSALAERTFVQWEEMTDVHRGAVACRPALLESVGAGARPRSGQGTFVSLGSHTAGFDRCLRMVDEAVARGILPGPVRSQVGHSDLVPASFAPTRWRSPGDMRQAIAESEVIVCHGGAGVISAVLRAGRRPIVVPRLERHREHVDDHQEEIARKLAELELVVVADDRITSEAVRAAKHPLPSAVGWARLPSLAGSVEQELTRRTAR